MLLLLKDINLFNKLTNLYNIPVELSPLLIKIFKDGKKRYGSRAWSSMIVKRLEDDCKTNLRAAGFPSELIDKESRKKGFEI